MSFSQVLQNIQQNIVANGVNAITADVLRPILESMLIQPNELIGDLLDLETADQTSLVNAINEALQLLGEESNLQVFSILVGQEDFTISQEIKNVQEAHLIAAEVVNQLPIFTVTPDVLFIVKIFFSVQTTEIINGVEQQPLGRIMVQQTILNTGARQYGVGTPPVTANDFTVLTSTFTSPQTLIDLSSSFFDEEDLIVADLTVIRSVFNEAPNCVIRSSAVVTATVGDTTRNWLFTGGEGMWGDKDAKLALRDDMFFEIEKTDSVFKPQHNSVLFDKNYNIGTPTTPATGVLTLDLAGAKVGTTILMYYSGASLPPFVTQWLQETDDNFVANETCYIGLHLHKLDGVDSVITGVVNNL